MASSFLTRKEILEITEEVWKYPNLFNTLIENSTIEVRDAEGTAHVEFDFDGNTINFVVHKKFWEGLNNLEKAFVLAHECRHIHDRHGKRIREVMKKEGDDYDSDVANHAVDLTINDDLMREHGFDITKMPVIEKINVVCEKNMNKFYPKITKQQANLLFGDNIFELNYDILKELKKQKQQQQQSKQGSSSGQGQGQDGSRSSEGNPEDGEGQPMNQLDDHNKSFGDEKNEGSGDESTDSDEKEEGKGNSKSAEDAAIQDKTDQILAKNGMQRTNSDGTPMNAILAGNSPIGRAYEILAEKKAKRKWESIVIKACCSMLKDEFADEEMWHPNRRLGDLLEVMKAIVPTEKEIEKVTEVKDKKKIVLYLDVSGSCEGYKTRFVTLFKSIPEETFDVEAYSFDTEVYPIEGNRRDKNIKIYGGGGTSFSIIDKHVNKMQKYPDAIFIITDGYGDKINPIKPKKWFWLLTEGSTKSCIPSQSKVYELKNFE